MNMWMDDAYWVDMYDHNASLLYVFLFSSLVTEGYTLNTL